MGGFILWSQVFSKNLYLHGETNSLFPPSFSLPLLVVSVLTRVLRWMVLGGSCRKVRKFTQSRQENIHHVFITFQLSVQQCNVSVQQCNVSVHCAHCAHNWAPAIDAQAGLLLRFIRGSNFSDRLYRHYCRTRSRDHVKVGSSDWQVPCWLSFN